MRCSIAALVRARYAAQQEGRVVPPPALTMSQIQNLEPRRLLAGVILDSHGLLTVTGTDAAETIAVTWASPNAVIKINSVTRQTYKASSISRILIDGRGGDDHLSIETHF